MTLARVGSDRAPGARVPEPRQGSAAGVDAITLTTQKVVERIRVATWRDPVPGHWFTDIVCLASEGGLTYEAARRIQLPDCDVGDVITLCSSGVEIAWHVQRQTQLTVATAIRFAQMHFASMEKEHGRPILSLICDEELHPDAFAHKLYWARGYYTNVQQRWEALLAELVACRVYPEGSAEVLVTAAVDEEAKRDVLTRLVTGDDPNTRESERAREKLQAIIDAFGLSMQEAADTIGVSRETLRKLMLKSELIRAEYQARIDEALTVLQYALMALRPQALPKVARRVSPALKHHTPVDYLVARKFIELRRHFEAIANEDVLAS